MLAKLEWHVHDNDAFVSRSFHKIIDIFDHIIDFYDVPYSAVQLSDRRKKVVCVIDKDDGGFSRVHFLVLVEGVGFEPCAVDSTRVPVYVLHYLLALRNCSTRVAKYTGVSCIG